MIALLLVFLLVIRWSKKLNIQARLEIMQELLNPTPPQPQQQKEESPSTPPRDQPPMPRSQVTSPEHPKMALKNPGQILITPLQ